MNLERFRPGSCEVLVSKLLQRLGRFQQNISYFNWSNPVLSAFRMLMVAGFFHCPRIVRSSNEPLLKDLQAQATHCFLKCNLPQESEKANAEADPRRRQQNRTLNSRSNLSPLARFLLSRSVEQPLYCLWLCLEPSSFLSFMLYLTGSRNALLNDALLTQESTAFLFMRWIWETFLLLYCFYVRWQGQVSRDLNPAWGTKMNG